jgi:hypothetical protein
MNRLHGRCRWRFCSVVAEQAEHGCSQGCRRFAPPHCWACGWARRCMADWQFWQSCYLYKWTCDGAGMGRLQCVDARRQPCGADRRQLTENKAGLLSIAVAQRHCRRLCRAAGGGGVGGARGTTGVTAASNSCVPAFLRMQCVCSRDCVAGLHVHTSSSWGQVADVGMLPRPQRIRQCSRLRCEHTQHWCVFVCVCVCVCVSSGGGRRWR